MTEPGRRILLVLGTSAGGVGAHVRMLARGLGGHGHDVIVAGPRSTDEAFGFTASGVRFAEVPIADRPHPRHDLGSVARLRALMRNADTVHAHGLRAGALASLAGTGLRRRPRLVVTLHNAVTAGGAVGAVYRALETIVARRADHLLVVSPDLGDRMRALRTRGARGDRGVREARGARSVEAAVVPAPPLAEPGRTAEEVGAELAGLLGRPVADRPILLTVARLAQQKGLETLLDAAAGPYPGDPLFVIAGDGPLRPELQARIDAEGLPALLYGWAAPADLLQVAAAVIVPSRWEGQPLSVQEALRAGRPIVATRVGGIPDMVRNAAVLVAPGDPVALREGISGLLGDPEATARLARASARRGRELPGEAEALRAVLDAYTPGQGATGHAE
ncbi:glycosyltransferase [Sphaerimonospora thailandensis]|uniref:Glycosyl transferase n=1 Tax=Sphaerimonospora thailandensis TaxID=795644 RepID=A0A8J3R7W1_9ACTN|nr:glycosyltransferase [Sphaerimonospora thailandensis]GIH70000.1 glycosyl transferase [Sphaerimonospora thailandensis]